jgi:hypothetical protein
MLSAAYTRSLINNNHSFLTHFMCCNLFPCDRLMGNFAVCFALLNIITVITEVCPVLNIFSPNA